MKKNSTLSLLWLLFLHLAVQNTLSAQCVDGSSPTPVMMDTTIFFDPGVTSTKVKFPQFDPENGMLRCVKLTVTMTGIIDTVAMQNLSASGQTATFNYVRGDKMQGPGLTTPLTNSYNKQYGPFAVSKFDGNFTGGTDYASIPHDTVLHTTMVRNLTDSAEISQFYGHDSVSYDYNIDVSTLATITGGSSSNMVLTSAMVHFKFEYCRCAKVVLPIGLKNFSIFKTSAQTANLSWEGENDGYAYTYDVEISRDGKHFSTLTTIDRKYTANPQYLYSFALANNDYGRYYYRVRQHWLNGYVRYTPVRALDFANPLFATTSLYPNPSSGAAGIKFVNVKPGKMLVQVSNAHGQVVSAKELTVAQTDYQLLSPLAPGVYWVKITDMATQSSCVKQLLVQ